MQIQTHPSFSACYHYLQVSKGSDQKQPRKSRDTIFPIISLWGYFLDVQGQIVGGPIWPKFKLVQDNMHVLVTYKFKMDQINSNREKGVTSIF